MRQRIVLNVLSHYPPVSFNMRQLVTASEALLSLLYLLGHANIVRGALGMNVMKRSFVESKGIERLKWNLLSAQLFFAITLFVCTARAADPLDSWNSVRPSWCTNDLAAVTANSDYFVAVGANGQIITSQDGGTWFPANSGSTDYLQGAAFGNGVFVAVGWHGTILVSSNLNVWTKALVSTTANFRTVTFGNGSFLAAGDAVTATSSDGMDWQVAPLASSNTLFGLTYGGGINVGVGSDATIADAGAVVTSTNGQTWSSPIRGFDSLFGVTYVSSLFVTNLNGLFVAVGGNGPFSSQIITSSDGQDWQPQQSPVSQFLHGIAYQYGTYGDIAAYGAFVAVGGSSGPLIASSTNGLTWVKRTPPTTSPLTAVCAARNLFVAVGSGGSIVVCNPFPGPVEFFPIQFGFTNRTIVIVWPSYMYPVQAVLVQSATPVGPWQVITNAPHPYITRADSDLPVFFGYGVHFY
jgi:hypothetical protein